MSTDFLTSCLVPFNDGNQLDDREHTGPPGSPVRPARAHAPSAKRPPGPRPTAVPRGAGLLASAPHVPPGELAPFSWALRANVSGKHSRFPKEDRPPELLSGSASHWGLIFCLVTCLHVHHTQNEL